ncbi:hypothetical protein C8R44DRAFT_736824 [Mycena epipterygia]|nr:hypothetical protein C8R44DRAFT_736824 [Mycena epipterygia]
MYGTNIFHKEPKSSTFGAPEIWRCGRKEAARNGKTHLTDLLSLKMKLGFSKLNSEADSAPLMRSRDVQDVQNSSSTGAALRRFVKRNGLKTKASVADNSYYVPGQACRPWSVKRKMDQAQASSKAYYKNHEINKTKAAERMRLLRAKRKKQQETGTIAASPEVKLKRKRKRGQPAWLPEQARAERDMVLSDSGSGADDSGESDHELSAQENDAEKTSEDQNSTEEEEVLSDFEETLSDFELENGPKSSPAPIPDDAGFSSSEEEFEEELQPSPSKKTKIGAIRTMRAAKAKSYSHWAGKQITGAPNSPT